MRDRLDKIQTKSETGFLSEEAERAARDFYQHLTHQMLGVGDSDMRRQTNIDIQTISNARNLSTQSLHEGLDTLTGIMSGTSHSLLAKSLAIIAYTDISIENDSISPLFWEMMKDTILAVDEPGGREVLAGAFYARLAYHLLEDENGEQALRELDRLLVGQIFDAETEKRKLAIHVSARVIASLLDEDRLRMVLPTVVVHTGRNKDNLVYPDIGGYPYTLMYLPVGSLPQDAKLQEAVYYGMPHVSSGVLTRRVPRVLVGVEAAEVDTPSRSGKLISYPNRRYTHLYLRGLRKPDIPAAEAFRDERDYNWRNVETDASFDSLSFIGAVRVTRQLEKRFRQIDKLETSGPGRKFREDKEYKSELKRRAVDKAVNSWVDKIATPIVRINDEDQSILSIALAESQKSDGATDWGINEAREHLLSSIKALVLVNNAGNMFLRGEAEIGTLYQNHVWRNELTDEDKVELALALLHDPSTPLWNDIPENIHEEVVDVLHRNGEMSERTRRKLRDSVERRVIVRCETIMDTHEPLGLRRKREKED